MDSHFIETVLNLPEFRVFNFELGDFGLYLHLQRREPAIVCPRCHQVCERTKESRTRCLRDLPIFSNSRTALKPLKTKDLFFALS